MKPGLVLLPIALLLAVAAAVPAVGNLRMQETFHYYETLTPSDIKISQRVHQPQNQQVPLTVTDVEFSAFGKKFTLELFQNVHLFAEDFVAVAVDEKGHEEPIDIDQKQFLKGTVKGVSGSVVAAHIPKSGMMTISITTKEGEMYHMEPSTNLIHEPHQAHMVVYRGFDVKEQPGQFACGNTIDALHPESPRNLQQKQAQAQVRNGDQCGIHLVGDHLLYEWQYSNVKIAANYLLSVCNSANTNSFNPVFFRVNLGSFPPLFASNLGLSVKKLAILNFVSPTGLYNSNDVQDIDTYLDRVRTQNTGSGYCVAHVLTYRDWDAVGAAHVGTVCRTNGYNIGVSTFGHRQIKTHFGNTYTFAHEIGHNWGAEHDFKWPHTIQQCGEGLMSYADKTLAFSQCSIDDMMPVVTAATCFQ